MLDRLQAVGCEHETQAAREVQSRSQVGVATNFSTCVSQCQLIDGISSKQIRAPRNRAGFVKIPSHHLD